MIHSALRALGYNLSVAIPCQPAVMSFPDTCGEDLAPEGEYLESFHLELPAPDAELHDPGPVPNTGTLPALRRPNVPSALLRRTSRLLLLEKSQFWQQVAE